MNHSQGNGNNVKPNICWQLLGERLVIRALIKIITCCSPSTTRSRQSDAWDGTLSEEATFETKQKPLGKGTWTTARTSQWQYQFLPIFEFLFWVRVSHPDRCACHIMQLSLLPRMEVCYHWLYSGKCGLWIGLYMCIRMTGSLCRVAEIITALSISSTSIKQTKQKLT